MQRRRRQGWYEIPVPPPKEVRVNDIITIRVDTGARVSESAQLQRRRTSQYDALLNDWIVLEGLRAIQPAPQSEGDQRIQGNLNQLNRVTGQLDTTESLKFEIAATVAAVLPNGNIVLEAHRVIQNNNEQWMHSLSGVCRREDIGPNNVVLSKDIANLHVEEGRARPDSRLLQTRLADALVGSVRAVLERSSRFKVSRPKVMPRFMSEDHFALVTTVGVVTRVAFSSRARADHRIGDICRDQGAGGKHPARHWPGDGPERHRRRRQARPRSGRWRTTWSCSAIASARAKPASRRSTS